MPRVRVLSDHVANQIAAGEVIERPASVIKELVENSIDAGATRIEVEFKAGGSSFMRIEDNGCGMGKEDALLSLERHATSKISSASDLDDLLTMGFRGEALPSIASVSRFQLNTRDAESTAGTEILVDAGKMLHVRECGMPQGTRMTISKLFNSVPARRKFLKSVATEAAHIVQCVRLYALAHPGIGFTLIDDGRILFQSAACSKLQDRIAEIFGKQIANGLIEVDVEEDGMRLRGLVGNASLSRSSKHEMLFFVNNRPVENRTLGYAVVESYHGHIPKGRYPVVFLFLDISPERVDVNVHPAKREIRFREEAKVRGFAVRTLLHTLREASGEKELPLKPVAKAQPVLPVERASVVLPSIDRGRPEREGSVPKSPQAGKLPSVEARPLRRLVETAPARRVEPAKQAPPAAPREAAPKAQAKQGETELPASPPPSPAPPAASRPEPVVASKLTGNWRYLGWAQGALALFDTRSGLVLLDWKAGWQRIWYERLLASFRDGSVESQRLLLPRPVEFDPVSTVVIEENLPYFASLGYELSPFGRNFYRVEAMPAWIDESACEAFLSEVVDLLRQGKVSGEKQGMAIELICRKAAAKAARGPGEPRREEIEPMLQQLFACEQPLADPDGRPTIVEYTSNEILKRFAKRGPASSPDLF